MEIVGQTSVNLMTLTYVSWDEGQHDLHFMDRWIKIKLWKQVSVITAKQMFHGPVILPYILKTVWWMNIILSDNESVWPNLWPQNNIGHADLYFTVQWIHLVSWRLFDGSTIYFGIMSQCDLTFDFKFNVGHNDLYFIVQWFYLISWSQFDGRTSYFWIVSECDPAFDLKIKKGQQDLIFYGPENLPYILKTVWWINVVLCDKEWVWSDLWHQIKRRSQWPIFHSPVILPSIFKCIWWLNIILWYDPIVWPDLWMQNKWNSAWPIFHGSVILPYFLKAIWWLESVWHKEWPHYKK